MKLKNIILLAGCILAGINTISAQSIPQWPVTRYGVGMLNSPSTARQLSMGGSGIAMRDPDFMNFLNPASLAALELTNFDAGVSSRFSFLASAYDKSSDNYSNLDHLSIAFPLTKWWGTGFAIRPYSTVGYELADSVIDVNAGMIRSNYYGSGGLNQVLWSNGFQPFSNLFIGASAAYTFGTVTHAGKLITEDLPGSLGTRWTDNNRIEQFSVKGGMQYTLKASEKSIFTLGAYYDYSHEGKNLRTRLYQRYIEGDKADIPIDTVFFSRDVVTRANIPSGLGVGLRWSDGGKWNLYADYSESDWSRFTINNHGFLGKSFHSSIGAQFHPDITSSSSFAKQTRYRFGLQYAQPYANPTGNRITDYALSLGAGIPLRKTFSTLNIGFQAGSQGTIKNNGTREFYLNLSLGVTMNDIWFRRSKVD